MAGQNDSGQLGSVQFSNLVWQLKLQTERQLGAKDSLRDLLGDPARLEQLLSEAEARGDAALRKLASDIRAQQHASRIMVQQPPRRPAVLMFAVLVAVVILGLGWMFFGRNRSPAPVGEPVAAATAEAPITLLFRMHGSNTIGEKLGPALAEAYLKLQGATSTQTTDMAADEHRVSAVGAPGTARPAIEVYAHGSATAFQDLGAQTADLGMASRRIKPEERDQLASQLGDLSSPSSENVIGLDGVAVVVNAANPVQSLTIDQVARIFSGTITDWSQVGGSGGAIQVYARDDKSGTFDTFKALVLDPSKLQLAAGAHRYESSSELSDAVAADAGGIGFIGLPYVRRSKALGIAAADGSPAVVPTQFTVGTEDYPLSRRLYLYLPAKAPKAAADFVEFALSDAGQDVVKQIGFVSQNIYAEQIPDSADWPESYRSLVAGAQRLSVNFRFDSGGENLDSKAQRDLQRLVSFIGKNPGRAIMLAGFTDNVGKPEVNMALSHQRADAIAAALRARGIDVLDVRGLGSANPVSSNDSDAGRVRNRRVEVWIK